jgi:hypothetical protein
MPRTTCVPDLINPLDGLWGRVSQGSMHRFSFLTGSGFYGYRVELLLRQYGIRVWGREMTDREEMAVLVKRRQAVWAEYVLCRAGVPLTSALIDPRNARYVERYLPGTMPQPWQPNGLRAHSFVDHLVDALDALLWGTRKQG